MEGDLGTVSSFSPFPLSPPPPPLQQIILIIPGPSSTCSSLYSFILYHIQRCIYISQLTCFHHSSLATFLLSTTSSSFRRYSCKFCIVVFWFPHPPPIPPVHHHHPLSLSLYVLCCVSLSLCTSSHLFLFLFGPAPSRPRPQHAYIAYMVIHLSIFYKRKKNEPHVSVSFSPFCERRRHTDRWPPGTTKQNKSQRTRGVCYRVSHRSVDIGGSILAAIAGPIA